MQCRKKGIILSLLNFNAIQIPKRSMGYITHVHLSNKVQLWAEKLNAGIYDGIKIVSIFQMKCTKLV